MTRCASLIVCLLARMFVLGRTFCHRYRVVCCLHGHPLLLFYKLLGLGFRWVARFDAYLAMSNPHGFCIRFVVGGLVSCYKFSVRVCGIEWRRQLCLIMFLS